MNCRLGLAVILVWSLCSGCSGPPKTSDTEVEAPRGSFENAQALRAHLDEHSAVYGWSANGETFGFCSFSCDSREDAVGVVCYATSSAKERVRKVSVETWLSYGVVTAEPTGVKVQASDDWNALEPDSTAVMLGERNVTATMWSNRGVCGWEVVIDHNREAPYDAEEHAPGDCLNSTDPKLVFSPDAKSVGYALTFPGDHGCDGYSGGIVQ